jgi:type II secretory pathway component PulC
MSESKFPPGWDEERVRKVLKHYDEQTADEAVAEDEAAFTDRDETVMQVPRELVPAVRELIAKHQVPKH